MEQKQTSVFSEKEFSWRDGKHWFDAGILYFKVVKTFWYLNCLLLGVGAALLANVSATLTSLVMVFASPLVTAFMMKACANVANMNTVSFSVLWQLILRNLNPLMVLGLITAILSVISQYMHIQLLGAFSLSVEITEEMMKNMTGKEVILRGVLNIMTNLPIALALVFSPALILFKLYQPIKAIQHSFLGFIKSWKAFLTLMLLFLLLFFAVVLLASFVISLIETVMGAGSQMLVNGVVLFFIVTVAGIGLCAQYQAYTEVFQQDEVVNERGSEIYTEI